MKEIALSGFGLHQRFAEFAARTGDEVDDALRDARFMQRFHQAPGA